MQWSLQTEEQPVWWGGQEGRRDSAGGCVGRKEQEGWDGSESLGPKDYVSVLPGMRNREKQQVWSGGES